MKNTGLEFPISVVLFQFVSLAANPAASNSNSTVGTNMPTVKLEGLIDGAKSTAKLPGDGLKFQ